MKSLFTLFEFTRRLAAQLIVISILLAATQPARAQAEPPAKEKAQEVPSSSDAVDTEMTPIQGDSSPSPERQWVSAGLSLWLGFGIGHAVEDRFETVGYKFAIADGVGLAVATVGAISAMGDCASNACSRPDATLLRVGVAMLFVSRVLQVYDVFSFGADHGMFGGLAVLPSQDGQGLVTTAAFHF